MSRGHVPIRTCLICRAKRPKQELLRLTLDGERWILLDLNQRMQGRGAYVCPACLPRLRFDKRVQKAFRGRARGLGHELRWAVSESTVQQKTHR